jgi:hypothetical protein
MKTTVTFRNMLNDYTKQNEVIALFPKEVWDNRGNISSYQRVGQHGGASRFLLKELQVSMPWEYANLQIELESIGYDLEII